MKLGQRIFVGSVFFQPKLNWKKTKDGWMAKIKGKNYRYLIERRAAKSKEETITWKLVIWSLKNNERVDPVGKKELAMVYTAGRAKAIAELLEANENEAKPFKNGLSGEIIFDKERLSINNCGEWKIKGKDNFYLYNISKAYYLWRPNGCYTWNLEIRYPGGPDMVDNCNAWRLKNIASLKISEAIIALMTI
jgi:hypothetical protein